MLTPKQQAFAEQYVIDLNATRAYLEVYRCRPAVARQSASRLLTNANVVARIQELAAARSKRTEITADHVLRELARIGFADLRAAMSWAGTEVTVRDSAEIDDDTARAIQSVKSKTRTVSGETTSETTVDLELKMHGKVEALTLIGRHLMMWNEKGGDLKLSPGLEALLTAAHEEAQANPPAPFKARA